ncbi:YrdB family protein [Fructobacillus parabroussonetiae]|uniref:YrdB family protein n=1 Tax=Fructobacillus parabroussonetiae TaxID=2713174 RepID=UPI003D311D12
MKTFNDIIRFLMEIITCILLIMTGLTFSNLLLKSTFAGIIPVALMIIWAIYMAPKSKKRLPETSRLFIEVLIFGYTSIMTCLFSPTMAMSYLVIISINTLLDHKL